MQEVWRPVPDWWDYEVSNLGRVRSIDRRYDCPANNRQKRPFTKFVKGRMLKVNLDSRGYRTVNMSCMEAGQKRERIGRMVLMAFVGKPPAGKPCALHGPGGRTDDRLSNLSWGSYSENNGRDRFRDGTFFTPALKGEQQGRAKLTADDVAEIRKWRNTHAEAALIYGVSQQLISRIRLNGCWLHVPLTDQALIDACKGRRTVNNQGTGNPNAVLNEAAVKQIREAQGSTASIARRWSVSWTTVAQIKKGLKWQHVA